MLQGDPTAKSVGNAFLGNRDDETFPELSPDAIDRYLKFCFPTSNFESTEISHELTVTKHQEGVKLQRRFQKHREQRKFLMEP